MEPSLPDMVLYSREGCHLCDETRVLLHELLAARAAQRQPVPRLVERDITANPAWERAYLETIPVVEFGGRRLQLATSAGRLRALIDEVLDPTGSPDT